MTKAHSSSVEIRLLNLMLFTSIEFFLEEVERSKKAEVRQRNLAAIRSHSKLGKLTTAA